MSYDTVKNTQATTATKTANNNAINTQEKIVGNKVSIATTERSADEQELKELYKVLRKPRSRKYMKALKMIDVLSNEDEQLIEEMRKDAGIAEGEEMTFQPEDFDTFKAKVAGYVEEEIRKEEERIRKEKEEEDRRNMRVVSPCAISGCIIHAIDSRGNILAHYTEGQVQALGRRFCMARDMLLSHKQWTCVEVYRSRLVHRSDKGDLIQIIELDETDWGE